MKRQILLNRIKCPDGTILISYYGHDYQEYTDASGRYSMTDGGNEYLRRGGEFEDASIYSDDKFEKIRENVCRGGRGKDGKQPLTWIPICEMSNAWVESVIVYNEERDIDTENNIHHQLYLKELEYRKENSIFIED